MKKKNLTALVRGGVLILLVIGGILNTNAQSNLVLQADFEGQDLRYGWDFAQSCCSYSLTTTDAFKRTGKKALRVELRKSDSTIASGKRAELIENTYPFPPDSNREWWAFSTFFPEDFKRDSVYEALAQWHFSATGSTAVAGSPPLSFQIFKGDFIIDLKWDTVNINIDKLAYAQRKIFNLGPWEKGVWNDWIFQYHFSPDSDGFLKIWKNGKLILEYNGSNFYRGSHPPYFKLGLYKWAWNTGWNVPAETSVLTSRVYYIDNVKIGNKEAILNDFLIPANETGNLQPIANAGTKQLASYPVTYATVNGSNSYDPDGKIVEYKWTQESGPNTPILWTPGSAITRMTNLVPGKYIFRLTVKDSLGASAFSTVEVEARASTPVNLSPYANAGSTKQITLPTNATILSSVGSNDPDGVVKAYKWSQESGPTQASISNPDSLITMVSNLSKGNYYFKLTVTDDKGGIGSGYVQVYVDGTVTSGTGVNLPPIAVVGADQYIVTPQSTADLDGSGSYDLDGTIAKYTWVQLTGPRSSPMTSPSSSKTQVTGLVDGTYTYRLYITDDKGFAGISPLITIQVGPPIKEKLPNFAPVLLLADSLLTVTLPTNSVTLDARASYDPDGRVVRYSWVQLSGPKASPMTAPSSPLNTINWLVEGSFTYRLYITDDSTATVISPLIRVNVVSPATGMASHETAVESGNMDVSGNSILARNGLVVYPNPVSDEFDIVLNNKVLGKGEVMVYDLLGRLILKDAFRKENDILRKKIQAAGLLPGQYLLDIRVGTGYRETKKLIKK